MLGRKLPTGPRAAYLAVCLAFSAIPWRAESFQDSAPDPCAGVEQACFERGAGAFDRYRRERLHDIARQSADYRLPAAPSAHLHGYRTRYSVLLIHGLNDSAYYMADLAELLHVEGMNTLSILLSGHGTRPEDMLAASSDQWREEVREGLQISGLLGHRVLLAGFSLGAALAIDATLSAEHVSGLLLFAPALELGQQPIGSLAPLACLPGVRSRFKLTDIRDSPVKYQLRSGNGVCQLVNVMNENLRFGESIALHTPYADRFANMASRIHLPTLIVMSLGDARVAPNAILRFASNLSGTTRVVAYGLPNGHKFSMSNGAEIVALSDEPLPHSYLVRRDNPYNGQFNPDFDLMAQQVRRFVEEYFAAADGAAARR